MTPYLVQPRDRIFVKGYGLLCFAKNMGQCNGENISKNWSFKYSQKLLGHAKQFAIHVLKTTSKIVIQKTADETGDLSFNTIADRITRVSKNSQQNNSQTVRNKHGIISNQLFKFKTKNWVGINDDDAHGMYNTNSQIKFKTSMVNSRLCNYSDAYILLSGYRTFVGARDNDAAILASRNNKQAIFKDFA